MTDRVRVAFVGAGYMTEEHMKAFDSVPGAEIAGVFSRSRDRAEKVALPYGARVCASIPDLFEQTRAEIIVASVPELAMSEVAKRCFDHPWLVLLEKPAGYNLSNALEIADAATLSGARAYVALNRRAYSSTRAAMEEVSGGGRRFIKVQDQQDQRSAMRDHHQPKMVADNYMFANSIHLIDYLRLFGRGEVIDVENVVPWDPSNPALVLAKIAFSSGDVGLYEGIWNGPGPWAVSISTPEKRVELRPLEQGQVQLNGTRAQTPLVVSDDDRNYKPGLRFQAAQAVATARGQSSQLATIEDSLQSMRLVADIFGMRG